MQEQLQKYAIRAAIGAAWVFGLKKYFSGGVCHSKASLEGKVVLITGANTGIGKETALDLAGRNAKIYIACRDLKKADAVAEEIKQKTGNKQVFVRALDLSSLQSVRTFAAKFTEEEKNLHILINNAGVMACPLDMKTKEGFDLQFGTNHLGHFLLTNLLLDTLKQSAPSRIVILASRAHARGHINFDDLNGESGKRSTFDLYGQSKLANVLFSYELARKLKGTGVNTYALHPGVVVTELGRYMNIPSIVQYILSPLAWVFFKTPKEGCQTSVFCAVDESLSNKTGEYYSDCQSIKSNLESYDLEVAKKLWEVSEKLVNQPSKSD